MNFITSRFTIHHMGLTERVEQDLHRAIKQRDDIALRTLRMLKAGLVNAAIAKRPEPLAPADEVKVVRGEIKRREEAAVAYQRGGRPELAAAETAEAAVLKTYLPAGPDAAMLHQTVAATIQRLSVKSPADFGRVMGAVMQELGANVDGKAVSLAVKAALASAHVPSPRPSP